jgi:methanogenic corrinoid protein MtbC1
MSDTDLQITHSIGHAASASGISPATLRMWERRYGRPVPVRLPSGHRRYTDEQLRWLRRVAEALARGARASEAVQADEEQLEELLHRGQRPLYADSEIRRLVRLARSYRSAQLVEALQDAWRELGPRRFVLDRVAPLAVEIGRAWADGRLGIRHEHLATAHLEDVLRSLRISMPVPEHGPVMVLTTLPGETHALGLQLVAMLATMEGVLVRMLGVQTPLDEIDASARETGAAAVGIGVSLSTGGPDCDRVLAELRSLLPDSTRLVVGGSGARGARRGPRHVEYVSDLQEMAVWLAELRKSHGGASS